MIRYRFYVGEVRKDGVTPVTLEAWEKVERSLLTWFSGFSRFNAEGTYTRTDGTLTRESSRVYEAVFIPPTPKPHVLPPHVAIAAGLADIANQESVLVTVEDLKGGFVYA